MQALLNGEAETPFTAKEVAKGENGASDVAADGTTEVEVEEEDAAAVDGRSVYVGNVSEVSLQCNASVMLEAGNQSELISFHRLTTARHLKSFNNISSAVGVSTALPSFATNSRATRKATPTWSSPTQLSWIRHWP